MEARKIELAQVMRVRVRQALLVFGLVRRRDDEKAAGLEDPLDLPQEAVRVLEMLDRLERHHDVEAGVVRRNPLRIALQEGQVVAVAVAGPGLGDRRGVDVDAGDVTRHGCEVHRAVTLAAGDVEHGRSVT